MTFDVGTKDGPRQIRRLILNSVDDALEAVQQCKSNLNTIRLDLLSPAYVHGGDGYRLDRIQRIWRDQVNRQFYRFQIIDGSVLEDDGGDSSLASTLELIFDQLDMKS